MELFRAQVLQGDEVILNGVDVWLNVTQGPSLYRWDGHFVLDKSTRNWMSGNYRIVLEDGRSGEFFVKNLRPGTNSKTTVDFQGTGPLEKPKE